ncbi:hypothetical protein GCM10023315_13140 [Algibacter aquimarinus]|uniref:HTH araC/xylS-type domain-containing protein n=2 Tax=Algibacter aquimarinus TaxID=1136748 RepID=A0ABP9HAB3_9FLAO
MQATNTLVCNTQSLPRVQIDSLIYEKSINYDMTQLELLTLYHDALLTKRNDSIQIFKKLALLNAELEQPDDAYVFTKKYINNTLDFSILNNGAYESIEDSNQYKKLKKKYIANFNWLSFLYLYVALIGFFFSVTINFTKKSNKFSKLFISCFVGAHSLFILEFVLYITNYRYNFPHTYRISSLVALLFGPLLYFYFRSVTRTYKFKIVHLFHVLPTIALLIFLFPMYQASSAEKVKMMLDIHADKITFDSVIFISKVISLSIYTVLIGILLFHKKKGNSIGNIPKYEAKWKKNIYRIHIIYVISYLFYGFSVFDVLGSVYMYYIQVLVMSIMVIYIAYMAYVQPDIFKNQFIPLRDQLFSEKYQKSGLTDALSKELKENLIKLLVEEKVYKENNINLERLSQKLNTTRHNASQIINEHFEMNFFELINKFRIKEATRILIEDVHGSLNIIDVAYEVGYNNKVTFNKAFKKETSLTPSEFIHSQNKVKAK